MMICPRRAIDATVTSSAAQSSYRGARYHSVLIVEDVSAGRISFTPATSE
jgi:hypothetical protein